MCGWFCLRPALNARMMGADSGAKRTGTLAERTEAFEKEVLLEEIRRNNFHMTNVAKVAGVGAQSPL